MTSAFDKWLTDDSGIDLPEEEYDPIHVPCGRPCSDHVTIQVTDEANGIDYETQTCPPHVVVDALWCDQCQMRKDNSAHRAVHVYV